MNLHETKKFYLVDANELKNVNPPTITNFKERTKPLISKELEHLDRMMVTILNNETLSQENKVREYNKVLAKYQETRNNLNQSPNLITNNVTLKRKFNPLIGISKVFKNKASQLWSLLENNNNLQVKDNGEVVIKERRIPGSNLNDLINTAVNKKFKGNDLAGWSEFQKLLIDQNIPRSVISNEALIVEPSKISEPSPPPPDILDTWTAHDEKEEPYKKKRKRR